MRYAPLVLLVEDDAGMRQCLRTTLTVERFRVVETESGGEALTQAAAHNPDLVVLDYVLPDLDGVQVTAKLREWSAAPIVIVSANDQEADKVAALDAGANDYVTKPFGAPELIARIRVWLRHSQRAVANSIETSIEVGDLKVDFAEHRAYLRGMEVPLTPTQFKLFAALMRDAGKVLTHEHLLATVWGPSRTKETQYLRIYMGQLRKKFEPDPVRCRYFLTEPGVGYRLRVD
jgi:two-component system KDP operon response regulator KdpE